MIWILVAGLCSVIVLLIALYRRALHDTHHMFSLLILVLLDDSVFNAHRATEAAADLERRLDDGVARKARRDRFEIRTLRGGVRRIIPFLLVRSGGCARSSIRCGQNGPPACGQRSRRRQSLALWASLPSARHVTILHPLAAGRAILPSPSGLLIRPAPSPSAADNSSGGQTLNTPRRVPKLH